MAAHSKNFLKFFRIPQNFFKHAKDDPNDVLEYDPSFTELIILGAIYNLSELTPENNKEQAFRIWLAAKQPDQDTYDEETEFVKSAKELFPDLYKLPRKKQLLIEKSLLKIMLNKIIRLLSR